MPLVPGSGPEPSRPSQGNKSAFAFEILRILSHATYTSPATAQGDHLMRRASGWLGLLATASVGVATAIGAAPPPYSRFEQLVEANTVAVHAYQVLLARKAGKGDPACYGAGSLSEADLAAPVDHQKALLAEDAASVRTWAAGKACGFDPGRDLAPLLPAELPLPENPPANVVAQDLPSP